MVALDIVPFTMAALYVGMLTIARTSGPTYALPIAALPSSNAAAAETATDRPRTGFVVVVVTPVIAKPVTEVEIGAIMLAICSLLALFATAPLTDVMLSVSQRPAQQ